MAVNGERLDLTEKKINESGVNNYMFTLHLFFVTITFSIKRTHRSKEQYAYDMRVKSLYDRAKEKASYNISSML